MGAWGITAFKSDAGLDFLGDMSEPKAKVIEIMTEAISGVIGISSYCSEVEMLAEIVASAYGKIEYDNKNMELVSAIENFKKATLILNNKDMLMRIATIHSALNMISKLDVIFWNVGKLEERKQYVGKLSNAIEEIANELKQKMEDE